MTTYIVTNRAIRGERIAEDGSERAKPTFRIAKVEDARKGKYTLLPDKSDSDYSNVGNAAPELTGSALFFHELYTSAFTPRGTLRAPADILFFIHGFNYDFSDNLEEIAELEQKFVRAPSRIKHLVYLSWPSRGRLLQYRDDQQDAQETGRVFARLLEKTRLAYYEMFEQKKLPLCLNRVHLAAHSMGNQVLYYALQQLDAAQRFPLFSEVVLLNADASHRAFEPGQPLRKLEYFCERTHIYTNRSDDALRISRHTKNAERRLGQLGPSNQANLPFETYTVNASDARGGGAGAAERLIDHWGFLRRPTVSADVRAVLEGIDEDDIKGARRRWDDLPNYFYLAR
jgi:esterase/lipase superfamily enzyme